MLLVIQRAAVVIVVHIGVHFIVVKLESEPIRRSRNVYQNTAYRSNGSWICNYTRVAGNKRRVNGLCSSTTPCGTYLTYTG